MRARQAKKLLKNIDVLSIPPGHALIVRCPGYMSRDELASLQAIAADWQRQTNTPMLLVSKDIELTAVNTKGTTP